MKRKVKYKDEKVFVCDRAFNVKRVITLDEAKREYGTKRERSEHNCYFYYAIANAMKVHYNRILVNESDFKNLKLFTEFILTHKHYLTIFKSSSEGTYEDIRTGCLISKEDIDLIRGNVFVVKTNNPYEKDYCYISYDKKSRPLHRVITNAPEGKVVDHADGEALNNTRGNLRLCDQYKNTWNRKVNTPVKYKKSSNYKGVEKKSDTRWRMNTSHKKVRISRHFSTEERAVTYYDIISLALKGEYSNINRDKSYYDRSLVERFYNLYLKKIFCVRRRVE